MAEWTPNTRLDCEQDRQSDADTYRQIPEGKNRVPEIDLNKLCPPSRDEYKLSLQCADKVQSPEETTELHKDRGNSSAGCITVAVEDVIQALEDVRNAGHQAARLPLVDDSGCPGVPSEHVYLDYGANAKRQVRRALGQRIHQLVLERTERDGWAYGPTSE